MTIALIYKNGYELFIVNVINAIFHSYKHSLMIPKGKTDDVNRRIDDTVKKKKIKKKRRTMIDKALQRQLNIEQYESHSKLLN